MTALEYIKNELKNMWENDNPDVSYKEFCDSYHVSLNKKELSMWFEERDGYRAALNIEISKNRCYVIARATFDGCNYEEEEIDEALKHYYGNDLVDWDCNPLTGWEFEFNMEYKDLDIYGIFADLLYGCDSVEESVRYYHDELKD